MSDNVPSDEISQLDADQASGRERRAAAATPEHREDAINDRCACGSEIVYFEDGDANDEFGEGCYAANRVFKMTAGGGEER